MLSTIFDIILRSAVIFVVVLVGLRILGKRHVAQLSIVDLVLILLISNAVQNSMVGPDVSLVGGIAAAVTLLVMSYVFTLLLYRSKRAERFFEGTPTLLVHNGKAVLRHLELEKITEEELERVIREHGIESLSDVKSAIMEADGTVSVIQRSGGEKRIETFKHRKTKYQQRKI
jgi:uncharacterized membrane protein YcaP (DUF421 family)